MAGEDEQSLAKRPEITPGPLVVGSMESVSGSLMQMTGFALERITRERTEVPTQSRLPERPVYFLDPNTRRMIMISNREGFRQSWHGGLFAEVVELDDEGKPRFQLTTQQVLLPDENYIPVAVGPNEFKMPPSYIEMTEIEEPGKEKFVPWNVYLGSLQTWMNEVTIREGETFESFMERFAVLRRQSEQQAKKRINTAFPGGNQGFNENVAPFNLIISDEENRQMYEDASRAAGLFPTFVHYKEFIEKDLKADEAFHRRQWGDERRFMLGHYLPAEWGSEAKNYFPALVTFDVSAGWRLRDNDPEFIEKVLDPATKIMLTLNQVGQYNPIFNYVWLARMPDSEQTEFDPKVEKEANGAYWCPNNPNDYLQFLFKVKADLLLTMFVRGGEPLTK